MFFFKTMVLISTKLGTNHPWVKGIQFEQMKDHAFFQGEKIIKEQNYIDEI